MKRLLLTVLLISSMFLLMTPNPAYARHQYLFWDETGDTRFTTFGPNATITIASGQIEFVDLCRSDGHNDKIYPASDIYIVPSGTIDVGSELEDVSGHPNTIITGSGGAFIGETIGRTGPGPEGTVGEGTYAVVFDECQDGKVDPGDFVLNPAFAVTAIPTDVLPLPSIELEKKLAETAGEKLDDLHKWLDDYFKAATAADIGNPMGKAIYGLGTKPFLSDPRAVVLLQVANQAKQYKGIAADPPDPQFSQLSPLLARTVVEPHSTDPLLTALADVGTQSSTEGALAEALLRSLERYQGADLDANGRWALMHARAIRDYARGLQAQLPTSSAALARLDAALAADATPIDALAADAQAFIARVKASGLTADEIQAARNLGLTDAQITQLVADIAALDLSTFSKANLQGAIADLRANNAALADEMGQLATDMAPIITTLEADPWTPDEAPQAQAGGPYTGSEGTAITFDGAGSTSPSATTTYAWDLDGDGAFDDATGATPSHTYTTPFAGVVGLQTTTAKNLSNIAYATVKVTDVNRRPKIDDVSPAQRTVVVDADTAQPFSVAASDPDGDPLSVRWFVNDAAAGMGPSFSYTPAASNLGVRIVEARVTDGIPLGGEVRHRWTVAVLIADADGDGYRGNVDCDDADASVNPGATEVVGNGKDDDCNATTADAGTAPVAFFNPQSSGRNVALLEGGATVHSVSSQYSTGYPATTLVNHDASDSYWATANGTGTLTNQWVKILLADGQTYLIDRVQLRPASHSLERVQTFAIDVSTTTADDAAFTTVLEATAADNTTLQEFVLPTPVYAKYIRYRPLSNRGSKCCIGTQQLTVLTGQQGGATVTFKNLSSDGDNNITAYGWDFGDGATSTEPSPTHTFARPGTYPVKLTVTDAGGNTHSVALDQRVLAPPTASFTFIPAQPNEGQAVTFTDTSADPDGGVMVQRSWSWGDKSPVTTVNGPTTKHTFADNGSYVVALNVMDSQGQTAQAQQTVTVANVAPTVNVGNDRTWVGERELRFDAAISDPGTDTRTCRWDFGDRSAPSTECTFRHTYTYTHPYDYTDACFVAAPPKVFTATLTVTDKDGGVSADSVQITVRPHLVGAPTSIVTNGDFETPVVASAFDTYAAPKAFGGWTVEFGSIDHIGPSDYLGSACGGQSVDVTGSETGAIYQDLPTIPGQTYRLRFAMAGNFVSGPAIKRMEVGWASDVVDTVSFDTTGRSATNMGWTYHEYTVKATSSVTRLRFKSLISGWYGPMVDDVSVVPVTIADPNQPPTVRGGGPYSVDEGGAVTLTASGSDPEGQPLIFAWDLDHDGTWETPGERVSFAAAERDGPSTHAVVVQATDAGGLTATSEATINILNVTPTATFNAPPDVAQGSALTLALTKSVDVDADLPTLQYAFDCGTGYGAFGASVSATCPTDTTGTRTVKGKIKDKDGGATEYTATVTVTNTAPTATFTAESPVDEGSTIALALTDPEDPSGAAAATFMYAFDCGAGYGAAGSANEASCPTPDSGTRTVKGKIIDQHGSETEYSAEVTVTNVAPTATLSIPAAVDEGSTMSLALADPSDPSRADTEAGFSYAFDCGDGTGYGAFASTTNAQCSTTDNGSRTVKGKVRDKDGGEREYTAAVAVTNVVPTVGPITAPPEPLPVNATVKTSAPFSDPGTADTHTAVWAWGDGTTSTGTVSAGTAAASHTYTAPGVYSVTLTVTDDDGGAGAASSQYVVVYDPSGGFVTGGGFIDSPAGAYAAEPSMTGRANFGFVSKYQKGAKVPTGQTQFQFQAGNLNFHSTAYEWLVVAGPKAQYKGTGTINGTGSYGFLLTANDGQVKGGGGVDRFRIKIWDTASGAIVYDNQRGAGDDAPATDAIEGGSVVIHSGK